MKKFFAIAVIAIAFVACNNEAENKETPADSTAVEAPVEATPAPVVDSTATVAPDSTVAPATN